MTNKIAPWASALLFLLIQTPVHAGVYKWVDGNGQVHYGERPGNPASERVKIRQNETTAPRVLKKAEKDGEKTAEGENAENTSEDAGEKPAEPAAEAPWVPEKISKKEKRSLCNEAKGDIATISSRGRMREINKKGEYTYLGEKQRQKRLAAARKKQSKYCR